MILSIFTFFLVFFANESYKSSLEYESEYLKYSKTKTIENNAQIQIEVLLTNVLGSLINAESQSKKKDNDLYKLKELQNKTINNFLYFTIILIFSIFAYFLINKLIFLSYLHIISIITLFMGITSPIFLMYVTTTIASSEIILQFESSNIIYSIEKLFLQDNYFVGGIILLFSIIFPFIKTNISFLALFVKDANFVSIINNFMSKFNKFSMADVFVLSIFLVYLSPNDTSIVKTELEIGFYFFFTYVMLSLLIGLLKDKNKIN